MCYIYTHIWINNNNNMIQKDGTNILTNVNGGKPCLTISKNQHR